jgi:alpha-beta hydrolase superfamily lysophospholipase
MTNPPGQPIGHQGRQPDRYQEIVITSAGAPIVLRAYPLGFLAELFTADLSGMGDGSIRCPVLVIAATGDPLFSFDYTRRVFERIVAPAKQLLVVDVDRHLLFNECVELVLDPLVDRIRTLAAAQPAARVAGVRR